MDSKRLEDKIDRIVDDIGDIKVTMARNTVIVDEHQRRSTMLEEQMKPLQKHVAMFNGVLKFIGVLGILAGIAEAIKSFL